MVIRLVLTILLASSCNLFDTLIGTESKTNGRFGNKSGGSLSLDIPSVKRNFYLTIESDVRTITIQAPSNANVECSRDAGVNWESCSGEFEWFVADYNNDHLIQMDINGETQTKTFNPSSYYPNLTFGSCTVSVTTSETIAIFNTRTFAASDVVCFDDGVVISNSGTDGAITPGLSNVTFYAREDTTVRFENTTENSVSVFSNSAFNNIDIYGIDILNTRSPGDGVVFDMDDCDIWDSTITITDTTNGSYAVKFMSVDSGSVNYVTTDHQSSNNGNAMYIANSSVDINNSEIKSGIQSIYAFSNSEVNMTVNINHSNIIGTHITAATGASPGIIDLYGNVAAGNLTLNLNNSKVYSYNGPAIIIENGLSDNEINLTSTELIRNDSILYNGAAILNNKSTGTINIMPDSNSRVCNKSNLSGAKFTSILQDAFAVVNFDPTIMSANPGGNTDIGLCN